MLQDIRDKSQGIVVKIIVGFIVVTFALFGVDALVKGFGSSDTVATVDGTDISRTQMLQGAELQRRQLISMMGDKINPSLLEDNVLQRRALDELIQRVALENQAGNLELGISDAQIDAYLLQAEQFQTDGKFDQAKYLNFVRSLGYTALTFKERMKQDSLLRQVSNAITESEFVLPTQIDDLALLQSQERSYDYVTFSLADESENTNVSDSELKAYYNGHKDDFKTPEQVKIDYVLISSADFKNKVSVSDEELQGAYQSSIKDAMSKEERKASHILIDTSSRTEEEAQKRLAEVKKKLDSGASFADLAKEYSDDIGSKDNGGDLGYIAKGIMTKPFEEALFSMKKGEIKSVKTEYGFHLIKLNDIKKAEVPSFESQKAKLEASLIKEKERDALLSAHENITDLAYASDALAPLAKEYGVDVLQSAYFDHKGGTDDITSNAAVIAAAFSPAAMEDGQNSDLIELNDDQVVVLHVMDHKPEAVQTFEEAKAEVTSIVVQDKARQALRDKAEKAKNSNAIKWTSVSLAERGKDEITSLAFSMPRPDKKPITQVKAMSNGDLVLIRLNQVVSNAKSVSKEQKKMFESYLSQTQAQFDIQALRKTVEDNADIKKKIN